MATKQIDILLNTKDNSSGANATVSALQRVEQQAQKTKQKMDQLANVGRGLAFAGTAILAPFALAMKKYMDTMKETEPTSKRLVELGKRWEDSQVRIGRVTAEVVLPALEKALDVVDKIATFTEANPGFVQSALTIGASLVILGGFISTTAKIVSTIAMVQGLAASAGITLGGAGAATATGTAVAAAGGVTTAGIGAAFAAVMSNPLTWAVAALFLTRPILNWLLGTNTTWKDIGTTGKQLLFLAGKGWEFIFNSLGRIATDISINFSQIIDKLSMRFTTSVNNAVASMGKFFGNIYTGITNFGKSIATGISNLINKILSFIPHKAGGGNIGRGIFMGGENGREFVMSNSTTRAAEQVIGGSLTQQKLLQALAGGGGKRISYFDARRFDASVSSQDRRLIRNDTISILAEGL